MKKITGMVLVWFCMVGLSWGGTLGDVNGDGTVGLPEAIHALQVSSGIRPLGATQSYDIADYFYVEGGNYEYRRTIYNYTATTGATPQKFGYDLMMSVVRETVDGKDLLFVGGWDYYLADPSGLLYKGYRASTTSGYESRWFTPPILIGSRNMTPGEGFTTFYEDPGAPGQLLYREYIFLGTENVTVPAGAFSGCLKILKKTQTPTYSRTEVAYLARGVGNVKVSRLMITYPASGSTNSTNTWSGYTEELVNARIGANAYPSNAVFYSGGGVWNGTVNGQPSGPGSFTWRFSLSTLPAWGMITLVGFNPNTSDMTMPLVSQDGIHFSASWYPVTPGPDFNLTVSGGTISGTYQLGTESIVTLTGSYSVTP